MDEAEHCHRLAFIQHGNIIADGTVDEIKNSVLDGQMLEISTSNITETIKYLRTSMREKTLPITNIEIFGSMVHVMVNEPSKNIIQVKNNLERSVTEIDQVSIIEPTLEDVFIASMQ
jgi:ABC-2 type transport system ATP-binding protein